MIYNSKYDQIVNFTGEAAEIGHPNNVKKIQIKTGTNEETTLIFNVVFLFYYLF